MLTRITLNGSQIAHGSNLTEALENMVDDGYRIYPRTVKRLFDGHTAASDLYGTWQVEQEPAMTGEMVRAACESGEGFVAVMMDMEGRYSNVG